MSEKFTLSRTMRPSDFTELSPEIEYYNHCNSFVQPKHWGNDIPGRAWECAMVLRLVKKFFNITDEEALSGNGSFSDWGCCVGLAPAMLCSLGIDVSCFEPWAWGDERPFFHRQIEQVLAGIDNPVLHGHYSLSPKPLCELDEKYHRLFDASLCISTLEHIGEYEKAFRQLCQTVTPGGVVFLTVDYSGDTKPDGQFASANVRPNGMPREAFMSQLAQWGSEMGFSYFGGDPDWSWTPDRVMVNDHGFASLAMVSNKG